jgi:hypothetical protein
MAIINRQELLTYEELLEAIENESVNNYFNKAARCLMETISDWPGPNVQGPLDLISELRKEINQELTFDNIEAYLKQLRPESDSWKMEALTGLLQIFGIDENQLIDKTIELEAIIARLTQHYRQKNKGK